MTETEKITQMIENNALTFEGFLEREISAWKNSQRRKDIIIAEQYYRGEHDIKNRRIEAVGEGGQLIEVTNVPNNKHIDNQYAKMVDQKTNYLFSKPFTVSTENISYSDELNMILNNRFRRLFKNVGFSAINDGVSYVYVYYKKGELAFKKFDTEESLPFWADSDHTELSLFVRVYSVQGYEGAEQLTYEKVEVYSLKGLITYDRGSGGKLVKTGAQDYLTLEGEEVEGPSTYNWERIPVIAFKGSTIEQPLINRVKNLQDGLNQIISDFHNGMEESPRNTILVLEEFDGQDLGEFRRNLASYGAVKVSAGGGVDTLSVEVNSDNYKAIIDIFRKAIIENARGFDAKDDRLNGTPNQMNIQSMYSDMDLDANGLEVEFQASFEEMLWFIKMYLSNSGKGKFENETAELKLNRNILINESESIKNCADSKGILSDQTILEKHPWVKDVEVERKRIEEEQPKDAYNTGDINAQKQGILE